MKYPLNEPFQAEAGEVIQHLYKVGFRAKLAIFDLPYGTTKKEWDNFKWTAYPYDLIQEICDIVLITPGIKRFDEFMLNSKMNYRWLINFHVCNLQCKASIGFSKQIPFILYARNEISVNYSVVDSYKINMEWNKPLPHLDALWYPKGQKPLEVILRLVENFSQEGDLVLDLFGGGFTTAVACILKNRCFLSSDISEEAVNIGKERIRIAKVQSLKKQSDLASYLSKERSIV